MNALIMYLLGLFTAVGGKNQHHKHVKSETDKCCKVLPIPLPVVNVPVTLSDEERAKQEKKDSREKWRFRIEVAGLIVLTIYAGFTVAIWNANRKSADAAKNAAELAKDAMHLDQRAWVGLDSATPRTSFTRQNKTSLSLSLIVKNTGKTPAHDMTIQTQVGEVPRGNPLPTWEQWDKDGADAQRKLDEIARRIYSPIPIVLVEPRDILAPGATREVTMIMTFDKNGIKLLQASTGYFLVRITYNDVFNSKRHTTTLCFSYENFDRVDNCFAEKTIMD